MGTEMENRTTIEGFRNEGCARTIIQQQIYVDYGEACSG